MKLKSDMSLTELKQEYSAVCKQLMSIPAYCGSGRMTAKALMERKVQLEKRIQMEQGSNR